MTHCEYNDTLYSLRISHIVWLDFTFSDQDNLLIPNIIGSLGTAINLITTPTGFWFINFNSKFAKIWKKFYFYLWITTIKIGRTAEIIWKKKNYFWQ